MGLCSGQDADRDGMPDDCDTCTFTLTLIKTCPVSWGRGFKCDVEPTSDYTVLIRNHVLYPQPVSIIVLYQGRIKRHLTIIAKPKPDIIYTICYVH